MWFLLEVLAYASGLGLLVLLAALVKHGLHCRSVYSSYRRRGIPGPKPSLFVGNFLQMRTRDDPNEVLDQWIDQYGNVFVFFEGCEPHLMVNDADMIQEIFLRRSRAFQDRQPMAIPVMPMNRSLVAVDGEEWRQQRRAVSPAFSPSKLRLQFDRMNECADVLVEEIGKLAMAGREFDIYERARALTLEVIAKCALAMDVRCQQNPGDSLLAAVKEFFDMAMNPAVLAAVFFPPLKHVLAYVNNHLSAGRMTDYIVANTKKVIQLRRSEGTRRTDLLQVLLDSADEQKKSGAHSMDDYAAMANAYTFLLAGYETTSTALAFTFYLMVKHPDVQERLYEEIRGVAKNGKLTHEDVAGMQYLDQVLNESLRLYPPITLFLLRVCREECEVYGQVVPEGAVVQVPVWRLHHDPQHYPDPWRYDPERFSPQNRDKIHPAAFVPFGIGPRNCIGMKFALMEAKLVLAKVLLAFRLSATENTEDVPVIACPTVISYPKNGVTLRASFR